MHVCVRAFSFKARSDINKTAAKYLTIDLSVILSLICMRKAIWNSNKPAAMRFLVFNCKFGLDVCFCGGWKMLNDARPPSAHTELCSMYKSGAASITWNAARAYCVCVLCERIIYGRASSRSYSYMQLDTHMHPPARHEMRGRDLLSDFTSCAPAIQLALSYATS